MFIMIFWQLEIGSLTSVIIGMQGAQDALYVLKNTFITYG